MGRFFGLRICIRITHCSLLLPKFLNHTHSCRGKVCSFTAWLAGRCGKFCLGDKMLGELGHCCCLKNLVMINFRVNESFLILLHFFFFLTRFQDFRLLQSSTRCWKKNQFRRRSGTDRRKATYGYIFQRR